MAEIKDLSIGSIVYDKNTKYYGKPIEWMVVAKNHHMSNSVLLVAKDIITYKSFDAKEPRNSDSNRSKYGNNRYKYSNIRQWLNSNKQDWYSDMHSQDQRPNKSNVRDGYNAYDNEAGFLTNFSDDFKNVIIKTDIDAVAGSPESGAMDSMRDDVFLLSRSEVGLGDEKGADGKPIAYFNSDSRRIADPTSEASSNDESGNNYKFWWLRTAYSGRTHYARGVYSGGSLDYYHAWYGDYGVRPALNIPSTISAQKDSSGDKYQLTFNTPPQISGKDENLGDVADEFTYEYTVFDEDNDTISVVERLNNKVIGAYNNVSSGSNFKIEIDRETLYNLELGKRNTLQIEARDEKGAITYRNIYFTRTNSAPIIIMQTDTELGKIGNAPEIVFQVSDAEDDDINIEILLDNNTIYEESNVDPNKDIEITISNKLWASVGLGKHEIKIIANDEQGGYSTQVVTFQRIENMIDVQFSEPLVTEVIVKTIAPIVDADISETSKYKKVLATNNGFDEEPVWEDITEEALNLLPYTFKNTEFNSENPGFNMRVIIGESEVDV